MDYYVIGDEDAVLGFRLVGVSGEAVSTQSEAQRAFDSAIKEKGIGIVIITEPVAELIRATVDRYTFTEDFPLIVEVPGR